MAKKMKNPEPELWERQVGESEEAYEAFTIYRDMEKRRFNAVAEQLHKSYALIRRWKDRWDWKSRTLAYDNAQQRDKLEKKIKERDAMYDRHINLSTGLQSLATEALKLKLKSPEELTVNEISRLVDIATKLDRTSRNEQISLEQIEVTKGEEVNRNNGLPDDEDDGNDVVIYMPEIMPEESCEMRE